MQTVPFGGTIANEKSLTDHILRGIGMISQPTAGCELFGVLIEPERAVLDPGGRLRTGPPLEELGSLDGLRAASEAVL